MHGQRQSCDDGCGCCSLRTGCITIGIVQLLVVPMYSVFFINMIHIPFSCLFYSGLVIGVIVAAPLIYGAVKQIHCFLWPSVLFNVVCVFAMPAIYYGIEIRNTRDPLGNASIWIYTALLITMTAVEALFTFAICCYICELRQQQNRKHKYNKVGSPADADCLYPLPV